MARISRTGTTDSTGVASTTVTGTGGGRLKFISRNGGLWSNSKEVLDCIVVDKGTSSEHNDIWATNSYMELNRFETYTKLQTKSTASSFGLSQYSISQTPICIEWETQLISKSSGWIFTIRNSGTIRYGVTGANCGVSDEEWHNVKFVIDGTGFKYYLDGELTLSNTNVYSFNTFQMDTRDGMSINFKNFKVYPIFTAPKHYTPIALSSSASIIQTGETATLTAELTNVLGEKLANKSVNFIEKVEHLYETINTGDNVISLSLPSKFTIEFDLEVTGTSSTSNAFIRFNSSSGQYCGKGSSSSNNITFFGTTLEQISGKTTYTIEYDNGKAVCSSPTNSVTVNNLSLTSLYSLSRNGDTVLSNVKIYSYEQIGTGTTNSQGIATCNNTITGTGKGERQFIASNSSILSEIYELIDGLWADIGTSNNYSDWRTSSTVDIARNTEYTTISPVNVGAFSSRAVDLVTGTNVIEFDVNIDVNTVFLSLRQNNTSVTNLSNEYLGIDSSLNQWHHIRLEWNETQYRAIVDGDVKDYRTFSNTPNRFQFSINANTGLDIKYKNFVMYTI